MRRFAPDSSVNFFRFTRKASQLNLIYDMLTSRQNPLIKTLRSLHTVKGRSQQKQFLLEGTHLIQAAVRTGYPLTVLCYSDRWRESEPELWSILESQIPRLECCSDELLDYAATTVNSDGIMAIATVPPLSTLELPQNLGLLLQTLQDPGNVGTILRTAAATGIDGIWLSEDSVDPTHPKLLRASAGCWFDVPLQVCENSLEWVDRCKEKGLQTVATSSHASQSYWDIDFSRPTIVVMGNEGMGLPPHLQEKADQVVKIPINSGVESLNVAIATALILYEAKRQRHQ